MTFTFRKALREQVSLIIGLAGGTGSGKTRSAMRLATGMSNGKPFAVIDTENGRALHYASDFNFEHGELRAPFRPDAYADAIFAADMAGYPVIVVDSASHEHAGDGGLLDWHEEEFQRMGGKDTVKMTAWIKPKMSHKHFVSKLLQVKAHIILCFRAEEKIEIVKEDDGRGGKKTVVRPKETMTGTNGWVPICEKNLPYEATASFLLMAGRPGVPIPIKLQEQHKAFFPLNQPISEETGRQLAQWAAGGAQPRPASESLPASEKPATDVQGPVVGVVALTEIGKNGTTNGKPWQIYYILVAGTRYATFSESIYEMCNEAVNLGQSAEFYWKAGKNNQPVIDKIRILEHEMSAK